MNIYSYIKHNGLKQVVNVIYQYKIDIFIQKIILKFLKNQKLKNVIVIESHNDFDTNGGAFYEYLISKGYNENYKIVWLLKNPKLKPSKLPKNVLCVPENKPSIKKDYYKCIAKVLTYDQDCCPKLRDEQCSIYFTHGSIGLKDCTGSIILPKDLNYYLTSSDFIAPIVAREYLFSYPNDKQVICGYPEHDIFYDGKKGDLEKITQRKFKKTILWMPTFRISIGNRHDSIAEQKLGIPLIATLDEYKRLDNELQKRDILLLIKIHPKQNVSNLMIYSTDNIIVLTGKKVKELGVDNIRLMKDVDALISDYSSAAYDFLHVDKPIAYDFSDLEYYTRGLVVEDPHIMMAGHEIRNIDDLQKFIKSIDKGEDLYKDERKLLFDKIYKYHDGNSCKRIAELLNL